MRELKIGELAELTGTSVPTIRYYEQIGLLQQAPRQAGGQRVYSRDVVERLTFIRRCREFDFSIEQVRALVGIVHDPKSSCMDARDMAAGRHVHRVDREEIAAPWPGGGHGPP
jgi:DNA-binding transcriptional MerR regulator